MAAVVKAVSAGIAADMGPPLGLQTHKSDGVVVDYFGGTTWIAASPDMITTIRCILSGDGPDPAELRQVNVDLAPFYCPDCSKNYCHADWRTYVLADTSHYDSTTGTCPGGHPHTADH